MAKLLYVKASPVGARSYSVAVADAFIASYREKNPKDTIQTIDLFKIDLPAFDGFALQAKYTILHGLKHSADELKAWAIVEKIIEEFKSADKYAFAVPMWNFGIPYRLKQYLDLLIQPGYTFSFSPDSGYKGLVTGKPAFVSYARGGEYAPGTPGENYDFQKKYFDLALGFIGFTDVRPLIIEPTLAGGADVAKSKRELAILEARKMAQAF